MWFIFVDPDNDDNIPYKRTANLFIYNDLVLQFSSANQFKEFLEYRNTWPSMRYWRYPATLVLAILEAFEVHQDSDESFWQDSEKLFAIIGKWIKENVK